MTEAEILQNAIQAAQAATSLFGVFLTVVSAYIVGLYLFLNRCGVTLRFLAFTLLTLSLLAIAALAWNLQYLGEGMHVAWMALPVKATKMATLGPPAIVQNLFVQGAMVGTQVAWALGGLVYLALFHMTFLFRWPKADVA